MRKFNVGVIGCGTIFPIHAEAVLSCENANLYAVCDIDEKKAAEAAARYQCRYFTDYREMLKESNIDSVHICTPHYLHASMAIDALKARKHVLAEKPMSISTADAAEMIRVSEETGLQLGVCFQNRYNTTSQKIKEVLDSGEAGAIKGAKAFVTWFRDASYYNSAEWRGTWDKEGGGVLINQAIHTLDLLQWFLGDIDKIKGHADTRLLTDVIEVEDTAEATILFKSGAVGLYYATNCYAANSPVEIEIVCENALLKLSNELVVTYNDGREDHFSDIDKRTGEKAYWGSGHATLVNDFYSRLASGERFPIDGRQAIKAIEIIQALYKSSESGKYVKL